MPEPDAPYVFLSYASADRERAMAVAEALERAGVRVWLDRFTGDARDPVDGDG